jgi:hypothetical protein
LTTKSCWLPGVAAPAEAIESAALLAHAETAKPAINAATIAARRTISDIKFIPVSPLSNIRRIVLIQPVPGASLNERSVNLDAAFPAYKKTRHAPKPNSMINAPLIHRRLSGQN